MLSYLRDLSLEAEEGQGMVEYGLIVGLIAIIVIAVFVALGPQIVGLFDDVMNEDLQEGQTEVRNAIDEATSDTS